MLLPILFLALSLAQTPSADLVPIKDVVSSLSYPAIAQAARVEGRVDVLVVIDKTGKVSKAIGQGGHQMLIKASEDSARGALRFAPAPDDVERVSTVTFVYRFAAAGNSKGCNSHCVLTLFDRPATVTIIAEPQCVNTERSSPAAP